MATLIWGTIKQTPLLLRFIFHEPIHAAAMPTIIKLSHKSPRNCLLSKSLLGYLKLKI